MISATLTAEAWRSSAAGPQHTSRSVTTPTTFMLVRSATTGAQPAPDDLMARAASAALSLGVQQEEVSIGSITSLQQLISDIAFSNWALADDFDNRHCTTQSMSVRTPATL